MDIIFTKFLEELPESVVFIDKAGIILEANPSTCTTFGYERHELIGKNVSILMPEPQKGHHDSYMQRHRETGVSTIIGVGRKLSAQKKDGTIFPIFLSISKHETQLGPQFVGVIRDLSPYEEKSADLKTLGELIDESISDVFILSDPELKIRYLNRRSNDRLAYTESELSKLDFSELMHDTEKKEFKNAIMELKKGTKDAVFLHSRLCSKDGKCYPVDMHLQRGIFKNSEILAITGIERSAEREAQRRLGAVLEGVPGYVLLLNKEFRIEFVNRSDLMPMEEVLGKHVLDFFTPDQAKITEKYLNLCQESQKIQRWEVSYDGPSGILWFSNALNAIEDNGYVLIASDITSLKEAQAQVSITSKLATIGELAAGIGHEINNPLTIVLGNLAAIKKELASETANCLSVGKRVDTIVMASERIKDIVRGFRTFARFDTELNERVSVHRCIYDTIKMVDGIFSNDQIRIVYEPGNLDVLVRGTYGRLQQILMNLFINARDALQGRPDATITVRKKIDSGQVVIDVDDNGPGIAKSIRHRLFYPFFTTKGSGKGTGLGLVISRKLAVEMSGSLDVVDN
nr:PAS domain S-box protein [Oligoflexales bacterium]